MSPRRRDVLWDEWTIVETRTEADLSHGNLELCEGVVWVERRSPILGRSNSYVARCECSGPHRTEWLVTTEGRKNPDWKPGAERRGVPEFLEKRERRGKEPMWRFLPTASDVRAAVEQRTFERAEAAQDRKLRALEQTAALRQHLLDVRAITGIAEEDPGLQRLGRPVGPRPLPEVLEREDD